MTESTDQKVARLMKLAENIAGNVLTTAGAKVVTVVGSFGFDRLEAALRTELAQGEPVREQEIKVLLSYVAALGAALRNLNFHAQTSGGSAGRDDGLVSAIQIASKVLSLAGISRIMADTTPQPVQPASEQPARCEYCDGAGGAYTDEGGWSVCHCQKQPALKATAPAEAVKHWCETCEGLGTIDETLGGEYFSNPKATCPDCDGNGYWTPTTPKPVQPAPKDLT